MAEWLRFSNKKINKSENMISRNLLHESQLAVAQPEITIIQEARIARK